MRIALVSDFFYPTLGGVQEHLYFYARELIKLGHQPTIITPKIPFSGDIETWWPKDLPREVYKQVGYGLPFFVNGSVGRTTVGFRVGAALKRLLTPENFDIAHLHPPLIGTLPVLANHFSSIPMVGTFHTSFVDSFNLRLYKFFLKRHVDKLGRIICVSPVSLKSIQNIFHDLNAEIIPNGIDTNLFKPFDPKNDDRITKFCDGKINILFMGRADPRNGLGTLIKAYAEAKKLMPNLRLLIAGGGDLMSTYQNMAKDLEAKDVEFLGSVRDERPQLYRTADIHVFGVQRAAFAVTILEGMASGLPIVTTDFEGFEFAGRAGEHFLTSPFSDIKTLTHHILNLAQDEVLRKKIGTAARKRALEFRWEKITLDILKTYEGLVDTKINQLPRAIFQRP